MPRSHTPPSSPLPPAKRPRPHSLPSTPTRHGSTCPYMPTIHPPSLDFDLPPICQSTLQSHNIYICLICGKYLQGRSPSTPAYAHSLQASHHLFLNYRTHDVYCLPDAYRVIDASFTGLSAALRPTFQLTDIAALDKVERLVSVVGGGKRIAGAVPLDSVHAPDYITVTLQLLFCARPLRDYLLTTYAMENTASREVERIEGGDPELGQALAGLCAKLWASVALRASIAPHFLLEVVARESKGRFGKRGGDPVLFVAWLLNGLGGGVRRVVENVFRGKMEVEKWGKDKEGKKVKVGFWYLPLDLPPKPLFKDAAEKGNLPQVKLSSLLTKFNGIRKDYVVGGEKVYRVVKLPKFLILVIRRFSKGKFGAEKNKCVVHLPQEGLDMGGVVDGGGIYQLLAAVVHEGELSNGKYRVLVRHSATKSWYDLSDMEAKPTMEQLVSLADTSLLLYGQLLPGDKEANRVSESKVGAGVHEKG